jgi:hypothetical protein
MNFQFSLVSSYHTQLHVRSVLYKSNPYVIYITSNILLLLSYTNIIPSAVKHQLFDNIDSSISVGKYAGNLVES